MNENRSALMISISNVQFAQPCNYFISMNLDDDDSRVNSSCNSSYLCFQRRTDISIKVKKPVFEKNVHVLPLKGYKI